MSDREEFEAWMRDVAKVIVGSNDPYPAGIERDYWRVWQASRATPADHIAHARDAVIEECAKVCETYSGEVDSYNPRNRAASVAMIGALSCAYRIRALITPSDERHDG